MNRVSFRTSGAIIAIAVMALIVAMVSPAAAGKPMKTIRFGSSTYSAYEGQSPGYASIEITRSVKTKTASVTVTSGGGSTTATEGVDYTAVSQVVTFPRGVTSIMVQVPIIVEGETSEGDETVELALSSPSTGWSLVSGPYTKAWLTIHEMPVPPTPSLSEPVVNGPTSISLSWGADSPAGYKWTFAVNISIDGGDSFMELTRGEELYELGVENLDPNTQYWFEIWALNAENVWSAAGSGWKTATTEAGPTPPQPTIEWTNPNGGADLQWTIGAFTDVVTFEVYRSTESGFAPSADTLVASAVDYWTYNGQVGGGWTDCAVVPDDASTYGCPLILDKPYYYVVRAVNGYGVAGPYSAEEMITPVYS